MKKCYNDPKLCVRAFDRAIHLEASTNAANVAQQAQAQYANVQMTKVNIQWQNK